MKLPDQRRLFRAFAVSVLAGIGIYAASVALSDLRAVGDAVGALGMTGWGVVLALSLANYALRFLRWQGYLSRLGHRVDIMQSALYYASGFAFTTTPGKAGEAVRSVYLKRNGVGYADSLAALFVERLLDLVTMVLLSALAVLAFAQTRIPVAILAAAVVIMLPVLRSSWLRGQLEGWHQSLQGLKAKAVIGHLMQLLGQSARLIENRPLYVALAIGLIAWGSEGVGLYVILHLMGVDTTPALAIGIYAVSVLVGALSFIPGGLGSTEATMGLMLTAAGADVPTAVSATLVCRLATLWFAVAIGLGCLGLLEIPQKRRSPDPGAG